MPWLDKTAAVLEAWYPGIKGADAIADLLFGDVNPSGRLPVTFPASLAQTPRPMLDGQLAADANAVRVNYNIEGSDVGYRWYAKKNLTPLFAFGQGLSYTSFQYDQLKVTGDTTLHVSFRVTNSGQRPGRDTPQIYLTSRAGNRLQRLIGWGKVDLAPGASQTVSVDVDPRLLADWSAAKHGWELPAGQYAVALSRSAAEPVLSDAATLAGRNLPP
jgi:beta-glucosidase